ncbi:SigE family RNA polymerase sigma factor [Dactylosporangium siamense]|uniref:RNA polymerase sigma24 factor n=1 Tax=Dactylosporangium siamense TaxID=685454 RepID=A0A919U8N6_9ACTN|nr:SigE family RNA polymerase sigma factor [Dactylosporangium siamense]GIG46749.1 RNA polymerase sigma24 factor [Dactylosporangium siamense]
MSTLLEGDRTESPPAGISGFDEFYAACFRPLTVQLFAFTGDMAAAQDVVQEAFCRALSRWKRVAEMDDPASWVRRVAWNLATSRWRRARTAMAFARRHVEEHVAAPSPDRVALARALSTLPEQQRRAVILHYLADLPITEIARQEGVAEGTVKSWLHRGRTALAAQLTDKESHRA